MSKMMVCKHKTIRDWPSCFEDCDFGGTSECPHHKQESVCVPVDSLLELSKENNRRFGAKDSKPKEGIKKILREALWKAYCDGRANNKYIPEEVLPDLMRHCQLFEPKVETEEIIEGLAKILYIMQSNLIESNAEEIWERAKDNVARGDWRNASREDAGKVLAYLSSHGLGDIEQAKREERERIIKYLLDSNIISADGEYFKALKQEGE